MQGSVKLKIKLQNLETLNTEDRSQDLGPSSGSIFLTSLAPDLTEGAIIE